MIVLKITRITDNSFDLFGMMKTKALACNCPFQVEFDVTFQCCANCFFCFQGNQHKETRPIMNYNKCLSVLKELRELGCYYIGFSGGEPFCRKDFLEIVRAAKKMGFIISIISNLQIPNIKQLTDVVNIGVNRLTVSFHAIEPDKYGDIFGVSPGIYYKVLDNIDFLLSKGCSVGIAVTVSDKNYMDMECIKKFFVSRGLCERDINFNMLISGKSDISNSRQIDTLAPYLSSNKSLKNNIIQESSGSFICSAGRISCSITPYGDVYPCTFFNSSAGNLYENSFKEIWEDSHLFKMIRCIMEKDFKKCLDCDNKKFCHVCMANNLNETGISVCPSTDYCTYRTRITNSLI